MHWTGVIFTHGSYCILPGIFVAGGNSKQQARGNNQQATGFEQWAPGIAFGIHICKQFFPITNC